MELQRLKNSITRAGSAGLKVVLDCHNYGVYWKTSSGGADLFGKVKLNSAGPTKANFRDLWRRFSARFKSDTTVLMYDLMNEVAGKKGIQADSGKTPAKTWEDIVNLVVADIRGLNDSTIIAVPVYGDVDAPETAHLSGPWVTGYTGIIYTAHHYLDAYRGNAGNLCGMPTDTDSGGGRYNYSYDSEVSVYACRGY